MKSIDSVRIVILLLISLIWYSNIQSQTGYLTKVSDLQFGDVFIGYSKEIIDTDIGAAKFQFYHTQNRRQNVRIRFTLPSVLTNNTYQIPIEFNNSHAAWSYNDEISPRTNFDPNSRLRIPRVIQNDIIYIWLGGRITTTSGLIPGQYTGDIILTIIY